MKLDLELVRKILMECENSPHGYAEKNVPEIEGFSEEEVLHHIFLMDEAGLVKAVSTTHLGSESPEARLGFMTWEGHEFLENSKNETLWQKIKSLGCNLSFGATSSLLNKIVVKTALQNWDN